MCVERRPVHHLVAGTACPGGVSAAVTEARLMTDQDLVQLYEDEQSDENEQREDPDQPE